MKKLVTLFCSIFMIVAMAVPAFAWSNSELPPYDDIWDKENYPYAILKYVNDTRTDIFFSKAVPILSGDKLRLNKGYLHYYYTGGSAWEGKIQSSSALSTDFANVLETSVDIVDESGNVVFYADGDFFPNPLWETMARVTQGEMTNLTSELAGTMKVLVPCGVGLMALLVVLSLFGKRSLISLR